MELEGRLSSAENLAEVIRGISANRMSGTLILRYGTASVDFDFFHGKLSGSSAPDRPRRLGQILLSRGLIDRAALEEALAYQADFSPGTPLGRVLIHRGRITIDDLREAVRLQIEEEMWDVLAYGDGFYQFKEHKPGEEQPIVDLQPEPLITEILSRREEWNKIRFQISSDSMVPAVKKLDEPTDRETLHLSAREWHVLSLVNGYYDVGCIAARSGLGRFETFKTLGTFLTNGLIELRQSTEPSPVDLSEEVLQEHHSNGSAQNAGSSSSSRWSGILSRIREEQESPRNTDKTTLKFDSPVSFLVGICNQIMSQLMSNTDFIVDPSDEQLAERYWRQILMTFPKADLVAAQSNSLTADSFDRYIRSLGVEGPMKSIYLETVDALNRYLRTLYLLTAQRLGSKIAKSLFLQTMEDMRQRSTIGNSDSFFFKEAAAKVLE